jgi:alcohol dehydrogenase class IV
VPHTLAGLKVGDEHIDRIIAMAVEDPTAGGNPRLFDKRGARTVFKRALEGRV